MIPAVMPTYGRADIAFTHGEGVYLVGDISTFAQVSQSIPWVTPTRISSRR